MKIDIINLIIKNAIEVMSSFLQAYIWNLLDQNEQPIVEVIN